jgi:hypothetical protein
MELTEQLYDVGYEEHLNEVLTLVAQNDAVADIILPTESLICGGAAELLMRLGVTVSTESVYASPRAALEVIKVLLGDLEAFDDYESLMAIYESGEPESIMMANLVAFVVGGFDSDYIDIIEAVSPKLMRIVHSILVAKLLSDTTIDHVDAEAATRAATFIATYPDNVITDVLDDGGYSAPMDELLTQIEIDRLTSANYQEEVALAVTGLLYVKNDTLLAASEMVDHYVELLSHTDDLPERIAISKAVLSALETLYQPTEDVEHDTA